MHLICGELPPYIKPNKESIYMYGPNVILLLKYSKFSYIKIEDTQIVIYPLLWKLNKNFIELTESKYIKEL